MIRYYPATSEAAGRSLSEIMWGLCQPPDQRQGQVTTRAFGVVVGANGQTYVCMPDDFEGVLHPDASTSAMEAMLQPFETNGSLPAGTIAGLVSWVEATRVLPTAAERTFILWDKFPDYFKALSVTELPAEAEPFQLLAAAAKR